MFHGALPNRAPGGDGMAWVEERARHGRTYRYAVWRVRVRRDDGTLGWRRRSKPLGEIPVEAARALAEEVALVEEGRTPRPKHVGPAAALAAFLKEWREVKRRRPETLDFYRDRLAPAFAFLSERGPLRTWQARWVVAYLAEHPEWSPRTVQMTVTALRTFAKWARRRGYECPDLARDVEGPRVPKPTKAAYSPADARKILAAVEGHRLDAPVSLALLAGLSLGDLRALTWADVDLKAGWIQTVRAKTGRPILAPIGPRLKEALNRAVPGLAHQTVCVLPKSDSSLYKAWQRLCGRAGVDPTGGLKRLRHTFATLLDAAGVDRATRRELMAHAPGSAMESLYTHSDRARLRKGGAAVEKAVR